MRPEGLRQMKNWSDTIGNRTRDLPVRNAVCPSYIYICVCVCVYLYIYTYICIYINNVISVCICGGTIHSLTEVNHVLYKLL